MSYEFIEPLEEKPQVGKKGPRKCLGHKILKEFEDSKARYARIDLTKISNIPKAETVLYCVQCLTLCERKSPSFSFPKLGANVVVYSDGDHIYLEKT